LPQEKEVRQPDQFLLAGRWFEENERYVCMIPTEMADLLDLTLDDAGTAEILLFGKPFKVIGIFDASSMEAITDLDGEPLTPVDYTATGRDLLTELAMMDYEEEPVQMARFEHLPAANLILAPQEYVNDLGGTLRSVAVRFPADDETVGIRLDRFMQRLGVPVVAAIDGEVSVFSAMSLSSLSGLGNLFIPLVVAALIILNTMMTPCTNGSARSECTAP